MKNQLIDRTKEFAYNCVKLAVTLPNNKLGNHIENQLIRCATSVAANKRAACLGQSKKAFIAKLGIVIEEADECIFWLDFLQSEELQNNKYSNEFYRKQKNGPLFSSPQE